MTAQELKNAILQLAVQGKLVPQNPSDEPAEELLKKIHKEKNKLVKEGKIKKEKPLPEITEDEIPFEIPESWAWVRLGEICTKITDGTHHSPPNFSTGDFMYITAKNIKDNGVSLNNITYVSGEIHDEIYNRCNPEKNDILLVKDGATAGVVTVNNLDFPFSMLSSVALLKLGKYIYPNYLMWIIRSSIFYNTIRAMMKGSAITRITLNQIIPILVPLPPLAEQKRIVAKIEELLPLVERHGAAEEELQRLNAQFPEQLRKSILQQAVQGKLVPQNPADGAAEELLKKIRKEKDKLVREGKIKKEKPLPEITEDEIPFEIPESWAWVRLGEIGNWHAGATPPRENKDFYNGNIPWLKTGDLTDSYITGVSEFITDLALEKCSLQINPIGTVLIAMYGATIGKLGITKIPLTTNQACCACMPYTGIYNRYLFYYLMAIRKTFISMSMGGAQPNISKVKIIHTLLPLPPLAEQKRIVEKIESLLPLCDELKQR